MSKYSTLWFKYWKIVTTFISNVSWGKARKFFTGKKFDLTEEQREQIKELVAKDYYIILINRKTHLTTYLIGALAFIKTRKWPKYSHALMNVDNETSIGKWESFKFMEATGKGVHYSEFDEIFDCDGVCLLKPANMAVQKWTKIIDKLLAQKGLPYDDLFDLSDATHVSCVELVRVALMAEDTYLEDFAEFEKMITKVGNLTPQMFRDCEDFKIALEF